MLSGIHRFFQNYLFTWRAAPVPHLRQHGVDRRGGGLATAFTIISGLVVGAIPAAIADGSSPPGGGRHLLVLLLIAGAGQCLILLDRALGQFELLGTSKASPRPGAGC